MDFDKTSFSVDWFTPGDKYAPKRLSFPKSARISIDLDELVSDSPLGFCFSPVDEALPRPSTCSLVDSPFEKVFGWPSSAPQSPLVRSERERHLMDAQDSKPSEENTEDWRALASPGILSITDDFASCGVDLDITCLDALDEQLLLSPLESFSEQCWAAAVREEVTAAPLPRRNTRFRARSFKRDCERAVPSSPLARDYPGSFERTRPLPTKITLPFDTFPHYIPSPSSDSFDTSLMPQEPLEYILYTDPEGRPFALPVHTPRHSKKRDLIPTSSFESLPPLSPSKPPKPQLQPSPSKSSSTLRVISDACTTFARVRRKSPL